MCLCIDPMHMSVRYGDAWYEIHSTDVTTGESKGVVMAGTLVVSDESADR